MMVQVAAFSQDKKPNWGFVTGNFYSDSYWYFNDPAISSTDVSEKILSSNWANINYHLGSFSIGIRFEAYLNTLLGYPNLGKRNDGVGLPFYWVNFTKDKFDITVGSFYEQFGNGLVLRSYEEKSLGIDNAFVGARVKFTPINGVYIKGFIGKQRYYWGLGDGIIRGIDAEISFNEVVKKWIDSPLLATIGGCFVSKYQKEDNPFYHLPNNVAATAGRINIRYKGIVLSSEYAYKINDPSPENNYIYKPGQAMLIDLSYSQRGFGINLSTKWVDNMSFRSDRNATLGDLTISTLPVITTNHSYALEAFYPYASQTQGEWGVKAEASYTFKRKSKLGGKYGTTFSIGYARVHAIKKMPINDSIPIGATGTLGYESNLFSIGKQLYYQEISAGITKRWTKNFSSILSYMHVIYNYNILRGGAGYKMLYANIAVADLTYKFNDKYALKGELQGLFTKQDEGHWGLAHIEFTMPHWFFSVLDNWNFGNPDKNNRRHYYNFGVGYVFGSSRIAINYGRQREGVLCVGGVCRNVPAASGIGLSLSTTF
jgi:hypothetical protein